MELTVSSRLQLYYCVSIWSLGYWSFSLFMLLVNIALLQLMYVRVFQYSTFVFLLYQVLVQCIE